MEGNLEKAKAVLRKYSQEHLLQQYETLNEEKKEILLNQILNINFDQTKELFENIKKEVNLNKEKIEPIEYIDKGKLTEKEKEEYFKIGASEIQNGKLAVVTMAGGQGTRLRTFRTKGNIYIKCKT